MPDLKLLPIPPGQLDGTAPVWLPFLEKIATRGRFHLADLVAQVRACEVQLFVAWDAAAKEARALAGSRVMIRGNDRIGELIWCTGSGRTHWFPLIAEIEQFHRDHLGCAGMRAVARPGWKRALHAAGYRLTHIQMDKDF